MLMGGCVCTSLLSLCLHIPWVMGTAVPCSQPQGWLIHTSANGMGSIELHTQGAGPAFAVLQLGMDRGSSDTDEQMGVGAKRYRKQGQIKLSFAKICYWVFPPFVNGNSTLTSARPQASSYVIPTFLFILHYQSANESCHFYLEG